MKPQVRKKINKTEVMATMYKPQDSFNLEKMDAWTYKVTLSNRDSSKQTSLWSKFEAERISKLMDSPNVYLIRHKI